MKTESRIGTMNCLRVKHIVKETQPITSYTIVVDGAAIYASALHAFTTVRDGETMWLPAHKLKQGDLIWVDVPHFMSDGSLLHTALGCAIEAYVGDGSHTKSKASQTKVFGREGEILLTQLKNGEEVLCADGFYHSINIK